MSKSRLKNSKNYRIFVRILKKSPNSMKYKKLFLNLYKISMHFCRKNIMMSVRNIFLCKGKRKNFLKS
jgi:hypothetical protein